MKVHSPIAGVVSGTVQAGIASTSNPDQLLIALEPEAASIYVRRQRLHQLLPEPDQRALMQSRRAVTPEPIVVHHTLSESMKAGPYRRH